MLTITSYLFMFIVVHSSNLFKRRERVSTQDVDSGMGRHPYLE